MGAEIDNEVTLYWSARSALRFCHSDDETDEHLSDLEMIALHTENDSLRRLCQKTIAAHRPLRLVSDPS